MEGSGHGLIWRINPESECVKKIMKKGQSEQELCGTKDEAGTSEI